MEHRGRATTKPGSLLRSQIPLGTNQWDQDQPGFLEADTVAHCGASMAGQFANSLDCVDIATTWTEQRAVWGRGEQGVLQQLQDIEESLPFDIRGFDCDNGAEFLNRHLVRHFTQRPQPVLFTRSRAYKKTTTPTSNRKTGPTSASGSAMSASMTRLSSLCSTICTAPSGGSSTTSSAPR
ncbi:MAG: hypothetical protein IPI61_11980 [Syntrophaceae bacterium]|nr:hypothetical protein [Syntrophaceae bacterium]